MKLAALTPFITLIAQVSAAAVKGEIKEVDGMTFTGQIQVGGPNVTLTGTARSIYEQVLKLNPAYDPMDFEEYRAHQNATIAARAELEKRDYVNCNIGGVEDFVPNPAYNCPNSVRYLRELNGYCGTGAYSCARTTCSDACGIHVCNDNNFPISIWCGNIAGDAVEILQQCAQPVGSIASRGKGVVYRDQYPKWNTVVRRC